MSEVSIPLEATCPKCGSNEWVVEVLSDRPGDWRIERCANCGWEPGDEE